jgi:hypothetical protein
MAGPVKKGLKRPQPFKFHWQILEIFLKFIGLTLNYPTKLLVLFAYPMLNF